MSDVVSSTTQTMSPFFASVLANAPAVIGFVGGIIGIISGAAVFARRRVRLVVTVSQGNDEREHWRTITIANKSDLSLSYQDFAMGWFIMTPLGRYRLNFAYSPEEETEIIVLMPHETRRIRIRDFGWDDPWPARYKARAYLRMHLHLPSRGRSVWVPVRNSDWKDASWRDRLLRRTYIGRRKQDPFPVP